MMKSRQGDGGRRALAILGTGALLLGACRSAPERDPAWSIVAEHQASWSSPPAHVPADYAVDGPLLGNGDIGVTLGGPAHDLRFYLSKNDFWRLRSAAGKSGPRVLGHVELRIPQLEGAAYRIDQRIVDGVTTGTFTREDLGVRVRGFVAAEENLLVIELSATGAPVHVDAALVGAEGDGATTERGVAGEIPWFVRRFAADVEIETEAAAALRVLGEAGPAFELTPDSPVTLVVALASRFDHPEPREIVVRRAEALNAAQLDGVREQHDTWWEEYWSKSWVKLPDREIERAYYQGLYTLAAASRDPDFPPSIFGTWVTTDAPRWAGDYHLNYNHMAPYYGLPSANRLEQADSADAPLLAFRERGRWYAREVTGTWGVLFPVGIGPLGIETTRHHANYAGSPNQEREGLFFQQRSNAAYTLVNIAQRWRCTLEADYGRRVYPLVLDVVDFWEDYLLFENGRYVVTGDAIHEGSGQDRNPILTLGLLRNAFSLADEMSVELDRDADRREPWRHILAHLSDFTTQERDGKTVWRYTEEGTAWWGDNTLGIQHIYPGNALGPDSAETDLLVSRNTIDVMQRWQDFNGTNSFFPAAVRVGYDPSVVWEQLGASARNRYPNGFLRNNPHGIENCSTVHNTVNEMLCMSHGNVLRVFAGWPRALDARFVRIRTWGAFLVSGVLREGRVRVLRVESERGRPCTLLNPWPGEAVTIYRDGRPSGELHGDRVSFETVAGEVLWLGPAGQPWSALADELRL